MKQPVMAVIGRKNPILKRPARTIVLNDGTRVALTELANRMLATVRVKGGIAIAAPQVGVSKRMVVTWDGTCWINPVLELDTEELAEDREGCLSLPGRAYRVNRPVRCSMACTDLSGTDIVVDLENLEARMIQHEVDHLDGILISDRGVEVPNSGVLKL